MLSIQQSELPEIVSAKSSGAMFILFKKSQEFQNYNQHSTQHVFSLSVPRSGIHITSIFVFMGTGYFMQLEVETWCWAWDAETSINERNIQRASRYKCSQWSRGIFVKKGSCWRCTFIEIYKYGVNLYKMYKARTVWFHSKLARPSKNSGGLKRANHTRQPFYPWTKLM